MTTNQPLRQLAAIVGIEFGVSPSELLGRQRPKEICAARFTLYHILRKTGASSTRVGKLVGRDHGSIISGIRTLMDLLETNDPVVKPFQKLTTANILTNQLAREALSQ